MKKKFTNMERRGLPGGPNEMFTYVTGVFSTEGYRKDSPDVNNLFNIIDSSDISMQNVEFPVLGIDNLGHTQMMYPGGEYKFQGDQVLEIPMFQDGGLITYKKDKDLIDSVANWDMQSDVDISSDYNDQIKARLLTGKFGFNPKTGELVKLGKSEQTKVTDKEALETIGDLTETRRDDARQELMDAYTANRKLVAIDKADEWNPSFTFKDEYGRDVNTRDFAGKQVYMTDAEADAYRDAQVAKNAPIAHAKMNTLFSIPATFTPAGLGIMSMQGAAHLTQDAPELIKDPSLANAGKVGLDLLMAGTPFMVPKTIPNALKKAGTSEGSVSAGIGDFSQSAEELKRFTDRFLKAAKKPTFRDPEVLATWENFKRRFRTPEGQSRGFDLGLTEDAWLRNAISKNEPVGSYDLSPLLGGPRFSSSTDRLFPAPLFAKDPTSYGYFTSNFMTGPQISLHPKLVMQYGPETASRVLRHELEHAVHHQAAKLTGESTTKIDDILSNLQLKKKPTPESLKEGYWKGKTNDKPITELMSPEEFLGKKQSATDYFVSGSQGQEKSAFAAELQEFMMQEGIIPKTSYVEITPDMVKQAQKAYNEKPASFGNLRIFDIMKNNESNYDLLSKALNKMIVAVPATAAALSQEKEGGEPMFQGGGGNDKRSKHITNVMNLLEQDGVLPLDLVYGNKELGIPKMGTLKDLRSIPELKDYFFDPYGDMMDTYIEQRGDPAEREAATKRKRENYLSNVGRTEEEDTAFENKRMDKLYEEAEKKQQAREQEYTAADAQREYQRRRDYDDSGQFIADVGQGLKDLYGEATGLYGAGRTIDKIKNNPIEFISDLGVTAKNIQQLPFNLTKELFNYKFGDGNFDFSNIADTEALGTSLDFAGSLPYAGALLKGVNLAGKGIRTGVNLSKTTLPYPKMDLNKVALTNYKSPSPTLAPSLPKPGLQIKSTMPGGPLEKQLSKTGEINIKNIQAHINKADVSKQDKFILQKTLDENFAGQTKINYEDFKAAVSENLVPLLKTSTKKYAGVGVSELGYTPDKLGNWQNKMRQIGRERNEIYNELNTLKAERMKEPLTTRLNPIKKLKYEREVYDLKQELKDLDEQILFMHEVRPSSIDAPLSNETILYSNFDEFGEGSLGHFSEPGALGHSRTLVTMEEPSIMHFLESQSDWVQKGSKYKKGVDQYVNRKKRILDIESRQIKVSKRYLEDMKEAYKKGEKFENSKVYKWQIDLVERRIAESESKIKILKTELKNPIQKAFLKNSFQERQLQENMLYAAEQGQAVMRYPTQETAAKIQGYTPDIINKDNIQTILRKYRNTPKLVKKTLGIDVKIVNDPKGNTWYEWAIPEDFLQGIRPIRALKHGGSHGEEDDVIRPKGDPYEYKKGGEPKLQGGGWLARYLRDIQPEYEYTFARPGVADPTMGPNFLARSFIGNTTNPRKSYLAMDADVGYATNANLDPYYGNFPLFGGLGLNYIGPRIGTSPVRASLDLEARYAPYKGVMGQFRAAPQIDFKSAKLPNPFNYVKGYVHPFGASYGIGSRPYQWGIENTLPENVNPYNVTSLETEPYSANWGFYSKLLAELGIGNKRSPFSIFGELSLNYDPVKGKADESYSQEVFDFATQSQGKLSTAITPQFRIGVKLDPEKGRSLKDKALLRIEEKKREEEQADRERREREYIESLSNTSEEVEEVIDKPESRIDKLRRRRREKQEAKREAEKEMVRHPRYLQDGKEVSTIEGMKPLPQTDRWTNFKRNIIDPAKEKADNIRFEALKEINTPIGLKGEMFTLQDNRKINATSGEAINPNRDLFTGQYNFDLIKKIVDRSKKEGVDPYQMIAIGLQESQLGKTDNNVGHILYGEGIDEDPLNYISFFKDKMKTADRLGIEDEAKRIQVYNGLGIIKPDTEKSYHGYRMDSIYGVPLTEAGIDMKKNPLYGKRILDLANNVIMQNKMIRDYVEGNKQKEGGENKMHKIYKEFVNGKYDGTEDYDMAEKIYDKLNRMYYKKAKEQNMGVSNYIMTNIINLQPELN